MDRIRLNEDNEKNILSVQQILNASGAAIANYLIGQGIKVLKENLKNLDEDFKTAFEQALKEKKNGK